MEPITNSVISILIQQLHDSLANENQTLRGFKNKFEKLKRKLEIVTSFLTDAQRLEKTQENSMTVETILARVRELVYDADDIVLDCQTRSAYENISLLHGYTLRGWSFRHNAGNILNQINIRIAEMEKQLKTYLGSEEKMIQILDARSNEGRSRVLGPRPHVLSPNMIIGLNEDTDRIIGHVTRNENSRSIGIVGVGGLGKTTIAQMVFNHNEVVGHFDVRIWVSVSHIFNPKDILASMLKQLRCDESAHEINEMSQQMSQIQQILKNKKYLIVMDDVWNLDYDWWRLMSSYLPEGEMRNKSIIVTTRNEKAVTEMGVGRSYYPRELNESESWTLFTEIAFHTKHDKGEDSKFQKVGKEIVKKCDGLPLAIKTVAGLLSSKPTLSQWKKVRDDFHVELANQQPPIAILRLSYDDLPATLKHCILSFSIFPEDCEIDAARLVYWWVGEGFVRGNSKRTAIEEASRCLSDLVNRCLVGGVKPRGYERFYKYRMHHVVRDVIIKMSGKETFSSFDVGNKQTPDRNSRHLGYTAGMEEKLLEDNSKLRAFLLMENSPLPCLQGPGLATIKSLRVLDLSQNEQESISVEDLLRWIKYQKRLAYLNLRRIRGLRDLPDWIRKRQNLQILILKECINLKRLPSSITSLQNLIVLDVDNCHLENLPRGLAKLVKLQVLSGFKLGSPGKDGARLRDLKGLKELRELGIKFSKKDDVVDDEDYNLSQIEKLKILSIDTKDCEQKQVVLVNKLLPPPSLQELFLRSYPGGTTPNWVSPTSLPELRYLCIDDSTITRVGLNFWGSYENQWKIEELCFRRLPRFQVEWDDVSNMMKYLRYVEVSHCYGLHAFPIDVHSYGIWVKEDSCA